MPLNKGGKMLKNFDELTKYAKELRNITVSVAKADDEIVLKAVKKAFEEINITPILIGNKTQIENYAKQINFDISSITVIDESDPEKVAHIAVKLISDKKADFLMKGLIGTGTLLKAFLQKDYNLRTNKRISHVALIDIKSLDRLVVLTDAAMNTYPNLQEKKAIVENAVEVLNALGVQKPKVAALAAIETVNEKMQPTIDAALLSKMAERGQIKNCEIDGPLAFDIAMSKEAAHHKGIKSSVAGDADILLVPNIESGNIVYKALAIFSQTEAAMAVVGAKVPVLITSRSDSYMVKFYSLALCKLIAVWGIS